MKLSHLDISGTINLCRLTDVVKVEERLYRLVLEGDVLFGDVDKDHPVWNVVEGVHEDFFFIGSEDVVVNDTPTLVCQQVEYDHRHYRRGG
jgi:hypothetical protein